HVQGVVHRDLKPSNVMVTPGGRVKVLDFGVAQRRTGSFAAPEDTTRTAELLEGMAGFVGTLPYVSPEQATGREVDGRADIFSLGVMSYALVSGRQPFTGSTAAQMLEAILREDLPPLPGQDRDPRLSQVELLVRRMCARDPERRFPGVADVRRALAAIRTGGVLPEALDPARETKTVAVAGFVNISGNPEDEWLGTGISETLTADSSQLEGVTVISRERITEILKMLSQQTGDQGDRLFLRAGRELKARWIVSGAYQRAGDAVRVTASLTDVASGQLLATTKVDGGLNGIFGLQDRIV